MKLSFEYLQDEILKFNAKSFLQQGSIIILRSIFKSAEEKFTSDNSGYHKCCKASKALKEEFGIEAEICPVCGKYL